jgi:hypothetical protein
VLNLVLLLLLVWFCLCVFLAAWALFFQGYIYTEPSEGLAWRAPAAGTVLALFVALWVLLDYRAPGRYQTVFEFSPRQDEGPFPRLLATTPGGPELEYKLRRTPGSGADYWRDGRPMPSRPDKVAVVENGEKVYFGPDRDADGKFKVGTDQTLHYRDARGREMLEGQFGRVSTFRTGLLLANLALNFLHFVAWFLCLWLLLRFQWAHALGFAVVLWAAMTLIVLPYVLDRAEKVAGQRGTPAAAARQVDARMCMMSPSLTTYVLPSRR